MYNTLLRMWKKGKLTEAQINKAVEKGWITEAQRLQFLRRLMADRLKEQEVVYFVMILQ